MKLLNVLHSPSHRTTTIVVVSVDLMGDLEVQVDVDVSFHIILEGSALTTYLVLQFIGVFFVELQLVNSLRKAAIQIRYYFLYKTVPATFEIIALPLDLFVLGFLNVLMVLQVREDLGQSPSGPCLGICFQLCIGLIRQMLVILHLTIRGETLSLVTCR